MGPDFLCIGLQKAGTRWLYQQLRETRGVWMPPVKEINYFCRHSFKPANLRLLKARRGNMFRRLRGRFSADGRFLAAFDKGRVPQNYNDEWYLSLFAHKGDHISGDVSPQYSVLDENAVSRVATLLPNAAVILLLRHPVDRARSHLSMSIRNGRIGPADVASLGRLKKIVAQPGFVRRSFPSRIWQRWLAHFGADRCRYFFLDEIRVQPERVRERIARFVGVEDPVFRLPADFNSKSNNRKFQLPAEAEHFLYEHFEAEIRRCREVFGSYALDWSLDPAS